MMMTKIISDWQNLQNKLKERFETEMDHDAILFMIGLQELDKPYRTYKKDEKLEVMHIGVCTVLQPYGFYEFDFFDEEGWPHYKVKEELPPLKAGEQSVLMKEAIVNYFVAREVID